MKCDENGTAISWQSTPKNFLFHHATLIRVYKAKLADELRAAGLYDLVDPIAWTKPFVVDIQAVRHGVPTLKYLAPYVHRVAINDIEPSKTKRPQEGEGWRCALTQQIPTNNKQIVSMITGNTRV